MRSSDQDRPSRRPCAGIKETQWREPVKEWLYVSRDGALHGKDQGSLSVGDQAGSAQTKGYYLKKRKSLISITWWQRTGWRKRRVPRRFVDWHNQRGQAENFNKEVKIGIGMERMPCGQSWANAMFFRIGSCL